MFIIENSVLATTVTLGLMKSLKSVDSSDFKSKYKNDKYRII